MSTVLNVRLSNRELEAIRSHAEELGVPVSTAARMLMRKGLQTRTPEARAKELLDTIESNLELRLALRRLVFTDPATL